MSKPKLILNKIVNQSTIRFKLSTNISLNVSSFTLKVVRSLAMEEVE